MARGDDRHERDLREEFGRNVWGRAIAQRVDPHAGRAATQGFLSASQRLGKDGRRQLGEGAA